jgi:hypothetical protein
MFKASIFTIVCLHLLFLNDGCDSSSPVSASGVTKANVQVPVGPDGLTMEQRNIEDRLKRDNTPGAIKHLYVISAYSGDVLIYSTVKGKVTSGSKRLTPSTVVDNQAWNGFSVPIGNGNFHTTEVLGDDGAYGSSGDYLYWIDAKGVYHQQYASSCIIHISDQPLPVKHVVLNMELTADEQSTTPMATPEPAKKNK